LTRLEWFDKGLANDALSLGIISTTIYAKWIQYKVYLEELPIQKSKHQAILQAAERTKCNEKTIRRAIEFFS